MSSGRKTSFDMSVISRWDVAYGSEVITSLGCNVPRVKFNSSASSSGISVKTSGKRSNAKLPSIPILSSLWRGLPGGVGGARNLINNMVCEYPPRSGGASLEGWEKHENC